MTSESVSQTRTLWIGKPWIIPGLLARSIVTLVAAVAIFWLEYYFGIASIALLNVQVVLWTALMIFMVWLPATVQLLFLRASNTYILRVDGLEVRAGIFTSKSFVIAPAGFSDLEVTQSVSQRLTSSGNIMIRTQGENDIRMVRVRSPQNVGDQIRRVMARPLVRIEGQEPIAEHAQGH